MTGGRAVYFNFQAAVNQDSAAKLISAIEARLQQGATELVLLISSPGGFIDPGMTIHNFLKGIPVSVTTHNYGAVDSVATVIYCAGKRRLASHHCRFLIHGVTWTFAQLTVSEHNLREALGTLDKMKRIIATVIASTTSRDLAKVEADMSAGLSLSASEAKDYGLVHELTDILVPPGVEIVGIR